MPKYLLTFEKGESVRWLGHLDILRTFERAIRRAGLPVAFSAGFNPRERLAFASALSTGVTGAAEPATLELTAALPAEEIAGRLNAVLPPGIRIVSCEEVPEAGARELLHRFDRAEYEVVCTCPPELASAEIEAVVEALMAQPCIEITREREGRRKTVDIRPFVHCLALRPESVKNGRLTFEMAVSVGEGIMARPAEIVSVLSEKLPGLSVRRSHRVRLFRSQEEGVRR
ncbi:MAG TPA: TIGR03936 family radical SAM-associated protein [Chthonomonadaceae bacterium]|nr:TIGR03936 family radical SAM-associated protein [Chthonomonadaceae bacterium]